MQCVAVFVRPTSGPSMATPATLSEADCGVLTSFAEDEARPNRDYAKQVHDRLETVGLTWNVSTTTFVPDTR